MQEVKDLLAAAVKLAHPNNYYFNVKLFALPPVGKNQYSLTQIISLLETVQLQPIIPHEHRS